MSFKRRVLSALQKEELLVIGRDLELDVRTSMRVEELRDAIAKSRLATVPAIVQESLSRDALKAICLACGLDDTGKEKRPLVERIVAAAGNGSGAYQIDRDATKGSVAREGSAIGLMLPGFDIPAKPPTKAKARRRDDSEAVVSGSLKTALRQFALEAAGGFRGRNAALTFTTRLLQCFGWSDGRPQGTEIPRLFSVAENGQRVEREVALWWPERRTMMEVASHDTVLDYAWKDLLRVCLQLDSMPQYVVLIHLHDDPQVEEEEDVPRRITIPKNVFVIGTVNVDETTYMFSPKVLDRAFVLEFNDVDLGGLAGPVQSEASESTPLSLVNLEGGLKLRGQGSGDEWNRFETFLGGEARALFGRIHDALAVENRHFGYRVAREVARFVDLAVEQAGTSDATVRAALDVAVLAKILPKLHGSQAEIEATLKRLLSLATGNKPEGEVFTPHGAMIENAALPLPRTARKLGRMLYRLRANGFVSFIE